VLLLELVVPWLAPSCAAFLPLCVFLGVTLSVKALPVLACMLGLLVGMPFGRGPKGTPLALVYILASGAIFVNNPTGIANG
jgi:hypothetical protein